MVTKRRAQTAPKELTEAAATGNGHPTVAPEQVAMHAYQKWQARGCPIGDDLRDWFEAEQELTARVAPVAKSRRSAGSATRRRAPG